MNLALQAEATPTFFVLTPAATPLPTVNLDDPTRGGTIDGQPHTLPPHSAIWYRFGYGIDHQTGKRPVFTLRLVNGKDSGVEFQVYAPENINKWWENHPTGRGTVQMIDCETGDPSETGECQSPDLVWQGGFGADGTYYVRVVNNNDVPSTYVLTLTEPAPTSP
jgi:hypothetical protein